MKYCFLTVLLLFLVPSCAYIKNVQLLSGASIEREDYVQAIPFELRKDLIVIKARLNSDTVDREFIFDTGAFNSKVEAGLAGSLGLPVVTEKTNSTAQGLSQRIEVVRIDSLRLGETSVYSLGAGKVNYGPDSASPCIAESGIIGANLIKLAHWKIDYAARMLYFSDKPFSPAEGSYALPFSRPTLSGTPSVALGINGREASNILFDVGYNGGLVLPLSLADRIPGQLSRVLLDKSTSGIYGSNADSLLVKHLPVNVGGYEATIPVSFSALNKALLGNEFLKHFTVLIDYDEDMIFLEAREPVVVEEPGTFLVGIADEDHWVVSRREASLPLQLGDSLLYVNGMKPGDLYSSYCSYFYGVRELLAADSLHLLTADGREYVLHAGE